MAVIGDAIYFPAGRYNNKEIWSYDLVTEVAVEVADLNAGWGASPSELTVLGSSIVFAADDGVAGRELWSYETVAGTASRLADIAPGSSWSSPSQLVSLGDSVYFTADDGVNGRELWQTDGTPAGTRLVRDLAPGAASSSPLGLTVVNDQLYFLAQDGIGTERLWVSDGTREGTVVSGLLLDNLVGFLGETAAGVLYVGSSAAVGNEVFVLPTDGSAATAVEPEGDVILSSRTGDGLYANGVPVRYDNDGLGGDAAVQIAKVFGVWDAIEAERVPQYGGDRNMLFAQGPTGAVYRIPADDVWRLYGVDQVGNAGSIPLFRSSPSAASSERTVPVEVAGTLPLRQDLLGRLFADGLPVTRDGQHVGRRWEDVANDTVLTAVAAELDSAALRLLWWAGDGTLREWRFNRDIEWWVFASDSAITVADAGAAFGVTWSDVIVTS
jgi:ELWxxDGT repeat protein